MEELQDRNLQDLYKTIHKHFDELINYPNVLNVRIGKKLVDGQEVDCITIFVSKKKTPDELMMANEAMIPKSIDGACTNVVELSTPDYVLGKTSVSIKPPEVQMRLAGGVSNIKKEGDS